MIARCFTRHTLAVLVALALLAIGGPATAQHPSPNAILIAKQIVELKGYRTNAFDPLVAGVIRKVKDQFLLTNLMWSKDLNEVAAQMEKQLAPRASELVDAAARIYASHFTEAELRDLLTFYQSPTGRKAIVEESKVLSESLDYSGQWGDNLSEEVINKMRAEMKKRGHDI
jgi:hypothetical protein